MSSLNSGEMAPKHLVQSEFDVVSENGSKTVAELAGSFSYRQLEKAGLAEIAEKVIKQQPLSRSNVIEVACKVSPPLLSKLVELVPRNADRPTRIQPVTFIPVSRWLASDGPGSAVDLALEHIGRVYSGGSRRVSLSIAIDTWFGKSTIEELLTTLADIRSAARSMSNIHFLGPSTFDLKMLSGSAETEAIERDSIGNLLGTFCQHGVDSIEGAQHLEIHQMAIQAGFQVAVSQRVWRRELSSAQPDQVVLDDGFVTELLAIAEVFSKSSKIPTWFPWAEHVLDSVDSLINRAETAPLGAQLLRAVAVSRLVLSSRPYVRAPLTLFGLNAAHLALAFGADDLGFAAVDSETADALGILKISSVIEIIGDHNSFAQTYKEVCLESDN